MTILWQALAVFIFLFAVVVVVGLLSYRWLSGGEESAEEELSEWGLGGRRFGTIITWFLVGGDLYTAYTLIAVPALVFGSGALGFFALPYTIIVYPLVLVVMPKLWQVASNKGMVTPADYVRQRFDSTFLALLVAVTGFVAVMPYIALQMVGIEIVLFAMGVPTNIALIVAFVTVGAFTYVSGLRAPALIAFIKDFLIYSMTIVAVVYIPIQLGGYGEIFAQVPNTMLTLGPDQYSAYATLALGSALALFLYPHSMTAVFGSSSARVVRRNASLLPAYTLLLGLIALFGYMAIAAGIDASGPYGANGIVPQLFLDFFPGWFVGYAFAAIAVGAVVPASIMAIAGANLFTRNIYREYIREDISSTEETLVSKIASTLVILGALGFVIIAPTKYAITLQLAGGVWVLQTLPALFLALYVSWLNRWALIAGWVVGIAWGTYSLFSEGFSKSTHAIGFGGFSATLYIGFYALVANLIIVFVVSALVRIFVSQEQTSYGLLIEEDYEEPERA